MPAGSGLVGRMEAAIIPQKGELSQRERRRASAWDASRRPLPRGEGAAVARVSDAHPGFGRGATRVPPPGLPGLQGREPQTHTMNAATSTTATYFSP